ncbi:hypothetical protein A8926_2782 [Saccharopolyspora spinosa]|uniref:Uncharacterized protein n=1 Tax=Saccharopolyspora spinosa TaxID=60894 RepID=A0A2N3XWS2_SACSN|nr:hypothetical protein A8926_2782 [Saccharopolyspora spinosa]
MVQGTPTVARVPDSHSVGLDAAFGVTPTTLAAWAHAHLQPVL